MQPAKLGRPPHREAWAAAALAGSWMLALNLLAPMAADDFYYACRLGLAPDGTLELLGRLGGLADVARSQKCVFLAHSGRLPVLCLAQLATLLPQAVFDVCNALVFTLLLVLVARLAQPETPRRAALATAAAFLLLWQLTPAFGQDFLWHTGALNYLWTCTLNLAFLLPYLLPGRGPGAHGAPLWFLLGVFSGWSMENQSAAACFLCVGRLAALRRGKQPAPRFLLAGAAGQLLGFLLLMLAPGNYRRSAGYGQNGLTPMLLLQRAAQYSAALWAELWWLILPVAALLALMLVCGQRGQARLPLWLAAGAAACHFSMVASPAYPMRSMLGAEILLIAALLHCLDRLAPRALHALCAVLALCFAISAPAAVGDLAALRRLTDQRAAYILAQRSLGAEEVTVPVARAGTRFSPLWGDALSDLMQDPCNERNRALAYYYGVPAVRGDPTLDAAALGS